MLKIRVKISKHIADEMQNLAMKVEGEKKIIKEVITDSNGTPAVLNGDTFRKYNEIYLADSAAYDIARANFEASTIPAELRALGEATVWSLTYGDCAMTIDVKSDKFDNNWEPLMKAFPDSVESVEIEVVPPNTSSNCCCAGSCK